MIVVYRIQTTNPNATWYRGLIIRDSESRRRKREGREERRRLIEAQLDSEEEERYRDEVAPAPARGTRTQQRSLEGVPSRRADGEGDAAVRRDEESGPVVQASGLHGQGNGNGNGNVSQPENAWRV